MTAADEDHGGLRCIVRYYSTEYSVRWRGMDKAQGTDLGPRIPNSATSRSFSNAASPDENRGVGSLWLPNTQGTLPPLTE